MRSFTDLDKDPVPMTNPVARPASHQSMTLLSHLLLAPRVSDNSSWSTIALPDPGLESINREDFDDLLVLARSNHVVVRGLNVLFHMTREAKSGRCAEWAQAAIEAEQERITLALRFLSDICAAFEADKYDVTVIKSLDHWPDLGSDLDLYTNAHPANIANLMKKRFDAQIAPPSWGDRLAGKWNFLIPGLPEAVEIHIGRLGQTGEQVTISSHLVERTRRVQMSFEFRQLPIGC
jgi:hypothetical protein